MLVNFEKEDVRLINLMYKGFKETALYDMCGIQLQRNLKDLVEKVNNQELTFMGGK